jgi:hypothetical protein
MKQLSINEQRSLVRNGSKEAKRKLAEDVFEQWKDACDREEATEYFIELIISAIELGESIEHNQ